MALLVLLKCAQHLGHFPAAAEIPAAMVNHIRICLRLPRATPSVASDRRTARRHQQAIREYLGLQPDYYTRVARRAAVRAVVTAAEVMAIPADLIKVAVD